MLKIAICEDNEVFALDLKSIIREKLFNLNTELYISCFKSGESLLYEINNSREKYDVIFFDIDLPGINGTQVARKIRELDETIIFIFITYLNEEIYKILDLKIFNFIRKTHFQNEIDTVLNSLIKNIDKLINKYTFSTDEGKIDLKLCEIAYFEVINRHVLIHTNNKSYTSTYRSLKDIPINLEDKNFYEIYRGVMINLSSIDSFIGDKVIMTNGSTVYIARRRLNRFKEVFYKYISTKKE